MQMFLTPEEKIIEQLRTENAALKEQMAHIKEIEFPTKCIAIADIWKNKVTLLDETIAQQENQIAGLVATNATLDAEWKKTTADKFAEMAEIIRLKDEALLNLLSVIDSEAYPTIQNNGYDAVARQPSPEILQDRDKRGAEACAKLVNRFISGDGILNDTWVHEIEDAIRSGEWRKYL